MNTEFNQQQYDLAYQDGIEDHWWHLARNRIVLSSLRSTEGTAGRVLDVGCGRGIAVKYLRAVDIDCEGVELASVRALHGVEKYIRDGTDAVSLPEAIRAGYATLTLLDVIEHLPEPVQFLRTLIAAFPGVERIVISVPARQEIWSNFDEYYGHFRRYDLAMLEDLALALDCRVDPAGYFFHAPYLVARLLSGRFQPPSATESVRC